VNTKTLHIGSVLVDPPVLQAPMAGFTDYAFREIVREFGGAGLLCTEMVSAKGFVWLDENESDAPDRLWGVKQEDRPLAVQIWDNDPDLLARAGASLAHDYRLSVVDINFGCPVRRVTAKARSGSYLLQYPDRIGTIVEKVVRACEPIPVTAKIRLGLTRSKMNAVEVAKAVESAGAAAITVHGRTARDQFAGSADWDRISEIKPRLSRIPLIGNGDLDSAERVVEAFRRYDVDGVMIGRAALGRPWIFRQVRAALEGQSIPPDPSFSEQREVMLRHYKLVVERFGAEKGTMLMRRNACRYLQSHRGARRYRSHIARVSTPSEFYEAVDRYFLRDGKSK
jgi:tRNA-dihydrouridine synthase B